MGALETNTTLIYGVHLRESANDGSDFTNAAADYRIAFIGEDGVWHLKDSSGTVTTPGLAAGAITTSGLTMATARLLGRTTASTGAVEEITVGSGLSLSAGSLSASGGAAGNLVYGNYLLTGASKTLTGSTAFAAVDSTADTFKFTRTTGAHPVLIGCHISAFVNNTAGELGFDVAVDGTRLGASGAFGLLYLQQHGTANESMNASFTVLTPPLSAASHTFELQWRISNAAHTASLYGGSGGVVSGWFIAEQYLA